MSAQSNSIFTGLSIGLPMIWANYYLCFSKCTVWRSKLGNKSTQIFHFTSVCVPSSTLKTYHKSLTSHWQSIFLKTWSREPFLVCFANVLLVLYIHRPGAILCKVERWCKRLLLISPKLKTLLRCSFVSSFFSFLNSLFLWPWYWLTAPSLKEQSLAFLMSKLCNCACVFAIHSPKKIVNLRRCEPHTYAAVSSPEVHSREPSMCVIQALCLGQVRRCLWRGMLHTDTHAHVRTQKRWRWQGDAMSLWYLVSVKAQWQLVTSDLTRLLAHTLMCKWTWAYAHRDAHDISYSITPNNDILKVQHFAHECQVSIIIFSLIHMH